MTLTIALSSLLLFAANAAEPYFSALKADTRFACSPIATIGCQGLFAPREADNGNEAALLSNGRDSLSMRLAMIKNAKQSIRIQALIFTGDEAGLRVAEILKAKKKENPKMDIRIIVDGVSNPGWQTQWMYYDLKQHKIPVEGYESLYLQWVNEVSKSDPLRPNKRFHDKLWIVDAEGPEPQAIMGGLNTANEYFRVAKEAKMKWRDQDIILRGPVVADLVTAFDRNFAYFKEVKSKRPDLFNTDMAWGKWNWVIDRTWKLKIPYKQDDELKKQVAEAENDKSFALDYLPGKMRFFHSRPRFEETYIHQAYLRMIREAREEILIANAYFIPEDDMIEALNAAAQRGVQVKIITNSIVTNDTPPMAYATRNTYKTLIENSGRVGTPLEIYEWIGKDASKSLEEGTIHAKYAVFDRKVAFIGSYNLDSRSHLLNSETIIAIESDPLASALAKRTLEIDLPKSKPITWEQAVEFHDPSKAADKFNLYLSVQFQGQL